MLPCEYGPECDSDDSGCGCLQLAPVLSWSRSTDRRRRCSSSRKRRSVYLGASISRWSPDDQGLLSVGSTTVATGAAVAGVVVVTVAADAGGRLLSR